MQSILWVDVELVADQPKMSTNTVQLPNTGERERERERKRRRARA